MFKVNLNGYREFDFAPGRSVLSVSYDETAPSDRFANGSRIGRVVVRYARTPDDDARPAIAGREEKRCRENDLSGDVNAYAECVENAATTFDRERRAARVFSYHANDVTARIGDLRKNRITWVDSPNVANPLGVMLPCADPETGESVCGVAYVFGADVDSYATEGLDIVKALNGRININDIIDGTYVRDEILGRRGRERPAGRASEAVRLDDIEGFDAAFFGASRARKLAALVDRGPAALHSAG